MNSKNRLIEKRKKLAQYKSKKRVIQPKLKPEEEFKVAKLLESDFDICAELARLSEQRQLLHVLDAHRQAMNKALCLLLDTVMDTMLDIMDNSEQAAIKYAEMSSELDRIVQTVKKIADEKITTKEKGKKNEKQDEEEKKPITENEEDKGIEKDTEVTDLLSTLKL